jgi:hypothetical protein
MQQRNSLENNQNRQGKASVNPIDIHGYAMIITSAEQR